MWWSSRRMDAGGLTRWALGSVADRIAHGDAPAVLLVRAETAGTTDQAG